MTKNYETNEINGTVPEIPRDGHLANDAAILAARLGLNEHELLQMMCDEKGMDEWRGANERD